MRKIYFHLFTLLFSTLLFSQTNVNPLIPYRDGKLWGFCDTLGKVVVKPYFDEVVDFEYGDKKNGIARFLIKKSGKLFVVNEKNKLEIPLNNLYDSIKLKSFTRTESIKVFKGNKCGVVSDSKEVISCKYDKISSSYNRSFEVGNNNLVGLINEKGVLIIPLEYKYITYVNLKDNDKFGWLAIKENGIKDNFYDDTVASSQNDYSNNVSVALSRSKSKSLIKEIEERLKNKFESVVVDELSDFAVVYKNNKAGLYNIERQEITLSLEYDEIKILSEYDGIYKAVKNAKTFIIDANKNLILEIPFENFYYDKKVHKYVFENNNLKGIYLVQKNKFIASKYKAIARYFDVRVSEDKYFEFFEIMDVNNQKGYIGENGVEYFKN